MQVLKIVFSSISSTSESSANNDDQAFIDELARLQRQEKEASDAADAADVLRRAFKQDCHAQGGAPISSSTNTFSTASTLVNTADAETQEGVEIHNINPEGIFTNSSYDDDMDTLSSPVLSVGAEADNNNMDSTYGVSPIPTHRINKDHPTGQILGDPKSAVQTRSKLQKRKGEHAFLSYI